ncbi:hypothetical protein SAMN04487969_1222 [Paenibacillus algorifonticola]|uniref:Uncharacterized protein n=1 Tax=Paenibacillus algorifonticola TaxID=684063 RepID=A0A1I2HCI9_9BACL|nr:hypothetical protein [Paenibacillus algorifonticola]SFF27268.1 hypothetical protein SAMN04487969_1222 [Paenibacillus algorifonticola]
MKAKHITIQGCILFVLLITGCSNDSNIGTPAATETPISTAQPAAAASNSDVKLTTLSFTTSRNADCSLSAALPDSFGDYSMTSSPPVELQGTVYHMVNLYRGDDIVTNALLSHRLGQEEVKVEWSETITDSNNRWYNSFHSGKEWQLLKLDEERLVFLEPEIIDDGGRYHLSALHAKSGEITRIREDFWPLTADYDYIYQYQWNEEKQQLFMQSYLGKVWFFDLQGEDKQDRVPENTFRVIPHSTTGAPSLFLSPDFERFVHNDESGEVTFFTADGQPLKSVKLPEKRYVASELMKWNPAGTVAWMDTAPEQRQRIKDIDIDYLNLAPQHIYFYNRDGLPIASLKAEAGEHTAIEVDRWLDSSVALIKAYTIAQKNKADYGIEETNISYYSYDVIHKVKKQVEAVPAAPGKESAEKAELRISEDGRALIYEQG